MLELPTLYERLGGVYAITTVVDDFIDRIMVDSRLNANPRVDEAHHRVPPAGFKYLVTEMVCWAAGGPYFGSRESTRMVVMALLRRSFKYSLSLRDKCLPLLLSAYQRLSLNCGVYFNADIARALVISRKGEPKPFCRGAPIILTRSLDALEHFLPRNLTRLNHAFL
jgi:hypothetical protein